MKTKKCTKCGKVKPLSVFYKNKSAKDGYDSWCKECCRKYYKQSYIRKIPEKPKCTDGFKYCTKCREIKSLSEFSKGKNSKDEHDSWCKECRKKQYKRKTPEKPICPDGYKCCTKCETMKSLLEFYKREKNKDNYQSWCKECNNKQNKKYILSHRIEINKYRRKRRKEDINYKLTHYLRCRVNLALKNNQKSGHTIDLIGCSVEQLKKYLENQFKDRMTWKNWTIDGWHIDHIKPCASFDLTKPEEQRKCFHYSNLQPLWAEENIRKCNKF